MAKKETVDAKEVSLSAPPAAGATDTSSPSSRSKALVQPADLDLGVLEANFDEAHRGIEALLQTDLSPEVKQKVQALMDVANPVKLGVSDELDVRWSIPRLLICQPTTTAVEKPANAKAGDMFTKDGELVEKSFEFVPVFFYESNVKFQDGQGTKAPECSAMDAKLGVPYGQCEKCPHLPYGKQNGGRGEQHATGCNNQINVVLLDAKFEKLYEVSFAKTSRSAGSSLKNMAGRGKYAWEKAFILSTEKGDSAKGVYFKFKVEPTGKALSPDFEKVARAFYFYVAANRKLSLGDYYLKVLQASSSAVAAEQSLTAEGRKEITAGLGSAGEGEEPADESVSKSNKVRSSGAPM